MPNSDENLGVVVVLFGSEVDGCPLSHCPLGTTEWFPDRDTAEVWVDTLPATFQAHYLTVSHREHERTATG